MAKKSGLGNRLYVHGENLSGDIGSIDTAASPRGVLDTTGIDSSAMERILTRQDGEISWSGFFNDAATQEHPVLSALPTTDVILSWLLGTAVGDAAAVVTTKQVNYDLSENADGSLGHTVQCLSDAVRGLEWMTLLTAGELQHTTAGSEASRDDGASSASGAGAFLHMNLISGTSVTVVIEDSANDSAWATLISFTTVSDGSEPTAEYKEVAGTVDRYLRITTTGTFTVGNFVVGIRRGETVDVSAYV